MPSPAAPFLNDSNNENTDKRAGRPPQATAWQHFYPTPNTQELQLPEKTLLYPTSRAETWALVRQREKVLPCTPFWRAEHLKGDRGTLPPAKLPAEEGEDFLSGEG